MNKDFIEYGEGIWFCRTCGCAQGDSPPQKGKDSCCTSMGILNKVHNMGGWKKYEEAFTDPSLKTHLTTQQQKE